MISGSAFPIIQGIEYGLVATEAKRIENSVRAGGNDYLTTAFQWLQGSKALAFSNKAMVAAGLQPFSWPTKCATYLAPPLLAIFKNKYRDSEKIRPILVFAQKYLGALCQLASAVSALTLLYLGNTLFAIPALVILGIGFLDRRGWLPLSVRQIVHHCSQPLLVATSLISGGFFDRAFAALSIAAWIADLFFIPKKPPQVVLPENRLTLQQMKDFLNQNLHLKINRKHIHCNPFPPVPNIDIQTLIQQFDQIKWEKHIGVLRQKLKADPRFLERWGTAQKTDRELIALTRNSLQVFVTAVKNRRILEGEPTDYEKLHNYLKLNAKYVQEQQDEIFRADALLRLSVEGGGYFENKKPNSPKESGYCGPGKFEAAESVFVQTTGDNAEIPLRDKVLYCLQDGRNRWMQSFYHEIFTAPSLSYFGRVIDWQDIHNFNLFANLYGDEFGLLKSAADNDATAIIDPLSKFIIARTVKRTLHQAFWRANELTSQVNLLIEAIGTPKLPKPAVYDFWRDWIQRQHITGQEKETLLGELGAGGLCGKLLEKDGKFHFDFVALMLFDMSIAELAPPPSHRYAAPYEMRGPTHRQKV